MFATAGAIRPLRNIRTANEDYAAGDDAWQRAAPSVVAPSAIRAGDSFVVGLTIALAESWPLEDALAYAVAAGAAAVVAPNVGIYSAAEVERFYAASRGDGTGNGLAIRRAPGNDGP